MNFPHTIDFFLSTSVHRPFVKIIQRIWHGFMTIKRLEKDISMLPILRVQALRPLQRRARASHTLTLMFTFSVMHPTSLYLSRRTRKPVENVTTLGYVLVVSCSWLLMIVTLPRPLLWDRFWKIVVLCGTIFGHPEAGKFLLYLNKWMDENRV